MSYSKRSWDDRYLDKGLSLSSGDQLVRIKRLRNQMDALRDELDSEGSTVPMGATYRPITEDAAELARV
jgi:hypothetical protein